jgi:fatty-acyl-CoA synthase
MTLPPRIEAALARQGTVTFIEGDEATAVAWAEVHRDACGVAVGLSDLGVAPGDKVAILGPTTRSLVTAIRATWLAGATVVVLPLPMRMGSVHEFVAQTRRRILGAHASVVLVDPQLAPFVAPEPGDPPFIELDAVTGDPDAWSMPETSPDDLAILQFTSGSTSDPKGVMLPHRAVLANIDGMAEAIEFDPNHDVLVSWLPLYHDMGLVGILTSAMVTGADLVLAGPQTFMASPARWMRWLSEHRGTVTAGPNFAWVLAARALRRLDGLDLSPLRVALNGAEPVDPSHGRGPRRGRRSSRAAPRCRVPGVRHGRGGHRWHLPAAPVGAAHRCGRPAGARDRPVRRAGLGSGGSWGEAPRQARSADPGPRDPDRRSGRGHRAHRAGGGRAADPGTSVTSGYYERPDVTAAAFDGDWLRTGDLAYLVDGELVICGRIKDVIIVAGRNVHPEDVERSVAEIEGIRAGNVIAFGVEEHARAGRARACPPGGCGGGGRDQGGRSGGAARCRRPSRARRARHLGARGGARRCREPPEDEQRKASTIAVSRPILGAGPPVGVTPNAPPRSGPRWWPVARPPARRPDNVVGASTRGGALLA